MRRILVRLAALTVLVALVPGGALALARWGRLDLIGRLEWGRVFSRPDDGSLVLVALTVIGWLAWLLLVAAVVSETIGAITHGAVRLELPGAGLFAPLAAVLVAAVAGLVAVQQPGAVGQPPDQSAAGPQAATGAESPTEPDDPAAQDAAASSVVAPAGGALQHTVADGDDLWSLAELYYGSGEEWRRIVDANPTIVFSPLDPLRPGMTLEIPDAAPAAAQGSGSAPRARPLSHRVDDPAAGEGTNAVQVDEGDSMWSIAEAELGDGAQWPRIAGLNEQAAPDPALIHPGQVLVVPAAQPTGGAADLDQGGH